MLRHLDPISPDPARLADGWEYRCTVARGRADELIQVYREAGLEVVADPVAPERLEEDCSGCRLAAWAFVTLYVRRDSR
jgi:hypothetical protein